MADQWQAYDQLKKHIVRMNRVRQFSLPSAAPSEFASSKVTSSVKIQQQNLPKLRQTMNSLLFNGRV